MRQENLRFERLYNEHVAQIHAYFLRRSPAMAQDATAEVFVVAWRRLEDVPQEDGALPWLYGVARNVLANQLRSERRRSRLVARLAAEPPRSATTSSPEAVAVRIGDQQRVRAALERIPAKYRETVLLVEWEGLSRTDAARALGISRAAVDQRLSRGYRKLERILNSPVPAREVGLVRPGRGGA